jgi:hypothetical protein
MYALPVHLAGDRRELGRALPYRCRRAHGLLAGDRAGAGPSPQRRRATFFPAALTGRFLARQESSAPPSFAALRPSGFACGCRSVPPPAG